MFKNLIASLNCAFGGKLSTRINSRSMLAIRLGGVELCMNERGESVGVSGVGAAFLDVDIDGSSRVIATSGSTVEALGQ